MYSGGIKNKAEKGHTEMGDCFCLGPLHQVALLCTTHYHRSIIHCSSHQSVLSIFGYITCYLICYFSAIFRKSNHFVWAARKINMMKQSLDVLIMLHIAINYITDVDIILQKCFELDYVFLIVFAFLSPTRKLPPLIWMWLNRLSNGSLWNLDVMMKSYPSASKCTISEAWHFNALTNVFCTNL